MLSHIRHHFSQNNHCAKLLVTDIIHAIKTSTHKITIKEDCAHTNLNGNNKASKLAKQGAQKPKIVVTPFHHIGHTTPFWHAIPLTPTQHDSLVRNLKHSLEKNANQPSYHMPLTPYGSLMPITQVLKFHYGSYVGNYPKEAHLQTRHTPYVIFAHSKK